MQQYSEQLCNLIDLAGNPAFDHILDEFGGELAEGDLVHFMLLQCALVSQSNGLFVSKSNIRLDSENVCKYTLASGNYLKFSAIPAKYYINVNE